MAKDVDKEKQVLVEKVEADPSDTKYWGALRKVRLMNGQRRYLVTRDGDLLNLRRGGAGVTGPILHPADFMRLPRVRRLSGQVNGH